MNVSADRWLVDADHAAIALFAAIVAAMLAGIGFVSRWGFSDNSPYEWAKYVGLSWFLIHFSLLAKSEKVSRTNGTSMSLERRVARTDILGAVSIGFLCRASGNSQGMMRQQSGLGFRDDPALV